MTSVYLLPVSMGVIVLQGDISSDDDTIFELAACAMQSQYGQMRR